MSLVPIILSGGAGTRLWPLSRETAPKPFLTLPDGETLLGKTAARAAALPDVAGLVVITNRDYYFQTKDQFSAAIETGPARIAYLLEPFGRNTGPAIALGALYARVALRHRCDPARAAVRSSDPRRQRIRYRGRAGEGPCPGGLDRDVRHRTDASRDRVRLHRMRRAASSSGDAFRAARFIEKPPLADAVAYLTAGSYVWNSGMFCFTPATILAAFREHAPAMYEAVHSVWQALRGRADASMLEIDAALFAAVPDISIDYAVMEKADRVAVIRGGFDWSDVGSWQAVSALTEPDAAGNRGQGERVAIDTRDTFVHAGDRIVATVGVDNLVIVDTPDAVLVAHRDHLQRVREVVGELKARGHDAYKLHRTVARPWGAYTVLQEGPGFKIKRIEVRPGGALSLQLHHRRGEHWVVVSGEARVTNGDRVYPVRVNESTFIPIETRHRLENPCDEPLVMIEVQCGDYLGEDDIVRFDDQYGRVAH